MGARWQAHDDVELRRLYADGTPIRDIAAQLARTEAGVSERRRALGLPARDRIRPWTQREDGFIRSATRASVPAPKIAVALGRTAGQVARRRLALLGSQQHSRPFTHADDEAIRRSWADGPELATLARELQHPIPAVRERARRLGVHVATPRPRWTTDEDAALRDGYRRGLPCNAIAAEIGTRTATAVAARAAKLGLAGSGRRWTDADEQRLIQLAARDLTVEAAARVLLRTPDAVRARARRLGVAPLRSTEAGRGSRPWSAAEDALLRAHPSASPSSLARMLGRSSEAVANRRRKLGARAALYRSPHLELSGADQLAPSAVIAICREVRTGGRRRYLALAQRFDTAPSMILRIAAGGSS